MCTRSCPTSAGTKQLIEEGKVTAIEIPKGKSELGLSYCWCEDVVRHLLYPDYKDEGGHSRTPLIRTPRNIIIPAFQLLKSGHLTNLDIFSVLSVSGLTVPVFTK